MKRILPAFIAAALIHAVLLTVDRCWLIDCDPVKPRTEVITMRLASREPIPAKAIHALPAPAPAVPPAPEKPVVKPPPATKPTPPKTIKRIKRKTSSKKVKPTPKPKPAPALVKQTPDPPPKTLPPEVDTPASPPPATTPVVAASAAKMASKSDRPVAASAPAVVKATPRYNQNPPPAYPTIARKRGYQGTVIMEVFVEADGKVGDLRIVDSNCHKLLNRAAMKAIKGWLFEPGRHGDRTVAMWVRVPISFNLK